MAMSNVTLLFPMCKKKFQYEKKSEAYINIFWSFSNSRKIAYFIDKQKP